MTGEQADSVLAEVVSAHPAWTVGPSPFGGWSAEFKSASGRNIHYVVCRTLQELAAKLATVQVPE
jgi:hypothetical protein